MKDKVELTLVTTAQGMIGGTDAVQGMGENYSVTIGTSYNGLSFNVGDLLTLILTDQGTGYQTQVGAGDVTGVAFNYCLTFDNKVYGLSKSNVYCSAVGQPTVWNDPNGLGNGFVKLSNWYSGIGTLVAMAPFQGKMAFFSRSNVQIWQLNANVDAWQKVQIMENIGTTSPMSVCGMGQLDVLFLNDSGIRSLQVRYADLNAAENDIGSPIDDFVQSAMAGLTDAQKVLCCGIVGAEQKRYWCFIPNAALTGGYIYVLSFYPGNNIVAWTKYDTTYSLAGVQTAFVPKKFVLYKGQVYATDGANYYAYGGADGNTYDNVQASMQLPFYDFKSPGHQKYSSAVDVDVTGSWQVYGSPQWIDNTFQNVGLAGMATFDNGMVGYEDKGSHFTFRFVSTGSTAAKVSSAILYYNSAETN